MRADTFELGPSCKTSVLDGGEAASITVEAHRRVIKPKTIIMLVKRVTRFLNDSKIYRNV